MQDKSLKEHLARLNKSKPFITRPKSVKPQAPDLLTSVCLALYNLFSRRK